jgi:hypothetical protein
MGIMGSAVNKERIIKNLESEFKPYCSIDPYFEVDDRSIRHRNDDSFIMMNFADNIVSAWRCLISETYSNPAQKEVVQELRALWERWGGGEIHKNRNGRWFRCLSLSECWIEDGRWKFEELSAPQVGEAMSFSFPSAYGV